MTATFFDIKRFAVHDGPGIRTSLFLKGCPLNCRWCHNPEGIAPGKQLWYFPNQCLKCGDCVSVCPEGALTLLDEIKIDRDKCTNCGKCTEICPTGALHFIGTTLETEEIEVELLKDRTFFEESGGGITLSGGEPLSQFDAAKDILSRMKALGIHTAVETSLYLKREKLEEIVPLVDFFLTDLKVIDPAEHKSHVGVDGKLILDNLKYLADTNAEILIRVPIIPNFTAHHSNLDGIAKFIAGLSRPIQVELMNFNPLARDKFRVLGRPYEPAGVDQPYSEEKMADFKQIFLDQGIDVK